MTSIVLLRGVRNQRQLARAHQRGAQLALVLRTGARDTPRQDLRPLRHERHQELDVLVVDVVDLVRAELADLAAAEHRTALAVLPGGRAGGRLAAATTAAAAEASPSVHRMSSTPMSNRSSRSSSGSPR